MANSKVTFGEYYFSTPAATTLAAATPAKAAGTTTASNLAEFTMPSNNRLTYGGADTRTFFVSASISAVKASASAAEAQFYIYKNGSPILGARAVRDVTNSTGALTIAELVSLATNDYLEVYLETDNGDDITIQSGSVVAFTVG